MLLAIAFTAQHAAAYPATKLQSRNTRLEIETSVGEHMPPETPWKSYFSPKYFQTHKRAARSGQSNSQSHIQQNFIKCIRNPQLRLNLQPPLKTNQPHQYHTLTTFILTAFRLNRNSRTVGFHSPVSATVPCSETPIVRLCGPATAVSGRDPDSLVFEACAAQQFDRLTPADSP